MIARPRRLSVATALAFIATSIPPSIAPKRKIAGANRIAFGASTKPGKAKARSACVPITGRRDPPLAIAPPTIGIATIAPSPRIRMYKPSVVSERPRRAAWIGTCGAQAPSTNPLTKKAIATAMRGRGKVGADAPFIRRVVEAVMKEPDD